MTKTLKPSDAIEQAMADALAAVERVEQNAKTASDDTIVVNVDGGQEAKPAVPAEEPMVPKDQLLRLAADFENYRKRAQREMDDARKYGIERLLRDLLPVIDNLDRALQHAEGNTDPVIEGVRMVAKQVREVLAIYGVLAFSSVGEPFDPERHEAVAQVQTDTHPPGSIMEEMLKGYKIHERLLRAAQVVVAAPPASTSTEGGPGGSV